LIKDGKLLLGNKKRGFGVNKLNGFGGKINPGESIKEAAVRELYEEVGLQADSQDIKKVGELTFIFPSKEEWNQIVHVFLITSWKNFPKEYEEMTFEWLDTNNVPYNKMWDDDKYWMPFILDEKKIKANFIFNEDNETIKTKEIFEVSELK
jgi:8-oxo-dGTP diphosphatase